jgi:hypothetical protein
VSIAEYLDAIKERLLTASIVASFEIARERITSVDGHVRARLVLVDGSQLEFSEYVQRSGGQIEVVTYSYHWADADGALIRRWDNAPHYPDLSGFPHHIHRGATGDVTPGLPMDIFVVLDEMTEAVQL